MSENPWLRVTRHLAREIDVNDYIHNVDTQQGAPGKRPAFLKLFQIFGLLAGGALIGQAILWACGAHVVSGKQMRLIEAVYRVDPNPERWSDIKLQKRLEFRKEAMDVIEHTVATPTPSTYPYLSAITGHPSPIIDPGAASAFVLLGHALDQYPAGVKGHLVQSIVSVAAALDEPDVQSALTAIVDLDKGMRQKLFLGGSARLKKLIVDEEALESDAARHSDLETQLAVEQQVLDKSNDALRRALQQTDKQVADLSRKDAKCSSVYRACLANHAALSR